MVEISRDLRADKQINKNLLDEEAEMQPYVYGEWAELVVQAKEDADKAKLTLDKVKSERFMFHKTPDEPGEKPATDKMAEHLVNSDPEVMKAHKAYITANKTLGFCKVAEESMQQKRSMIKILTELHTTKYFVKEEMGVDVRENKRKTKDAANSSMDENVSEMNKKRKKKKKLPKPEPIVIEEEDEEDDDLYGDDLDEDEELYDEAEGIGTTDPELEEDDDLDVDMEEDEEEAVPPKTKRTVKKGVDKKLAAKKAPKKRTVKEQAALNQIEGKKLQKEIADKKKTEKPKGKCPHGYEFGVSFGLEPECDECDIDNVCFKARSK